jgi:hypothetical protein
LAELLRILERVLGGSFDGIEGVDLLRSKKVRSLLPNDRTRGWRFRLVVGPDLDPFDQSRRLQKSAKLLFEKRALASTPQVNRLHCCIDVSLWRFHGAMFPFGGPKNSVASLFKLDSNSQSSSCVVGDLRIID